MTSRLPPALAARLSLPLIVAPMLRVTGPDLVIAACNAGAIGAFPTKNARTSEELDAWLSRMRAEVKPDAAPFCVNLVMRDTRRDEDLAALIRHGVEVVITSVGSPAPVMGALKDAGVFVLADVATLEHAKKALSAGVHGLVLLTAGAGGHTGWMNGLAFTRAVRGFFDGPLVLAGGISDGAAMAAARVAGCDLVYMGTRFIAARESLADETYRRELVASEMDDIVATKQFTGMIGNYMKAAIRAAGLDPERLDESMDEEAARLAHSGASPTGPRRWTDIRSAGHTVSGVTGEAPAAEIIAQTKAQYEDALDAVRR